MSGLTDIYKKEAGKNPFFCAYNENLFDSEYVSWLEGKIGKLEKH